jgi:transcriptional regulator with XRE-family HTH domain
MTKKDNPLRLRRLAAGLSQTELARRAGIHRSSLVFIEEGQTRSPSPETLGKLSVHLQVPSTQLGDELALWLDRQGPVWDHKQAAVLGTPHTEIPRLYPSFAAWRRELGLPTHRLAQVLGVSRSTVLEYESGLRVGGMPDSMISGLLRIGLTNDQALALAELEPFDRLDER